MIVNWKEHRLNFAQQDEHQVVLVPGCNEVSDSAWIAVRPQMEDLIKAGSAIEVNGVYTPPKSKNDKGSLEVTPMTEMEIKDAEAIVAQTNHIATLETWLELDSRDSVRSAIKNKIESVMAHGTK